MKNIRFIILQVLILTFCHSSFGVAASNEKELFVVAQRAFEDGFFDVSIRYIDQLLAEFPSTTKYVEAKMLEGQSYFFKKEYVKAFGIFKDLVGRGEYKDASLFWLGETYLKGGDLDKAQEQYRQVIEGFPSSLYASQAYYSLAWSYFQKGAFAQAKKSFLQLIEKFPSNNLSEDAAFKTGECDYNDGHYADAIAQFNAYIQNYPQSSRASEAQFNIAESFYNLEQFEKAVEAYQKAKNLSKDPQRNVSIFVGIGWSYMKIQKYDESAKFFDEAQIAAKNAKLPEDDILLGKASLFTTQEKFLDAIVCYSDLISRFPDSTRINESYLGRANAYYLSNQYQEAINDYKKVIASNESLPQQSKLIEKARFGLAWTYLKKGDLKNSIASFQSIVDNTDNKAVKVSALTQIADAYMEVSQPDNAIGIYDNILKNMPDTPYLDHVQYRLGVALLKSGQTDAAIIALQTLKSNYPKSKFLDESLYYLGVSFYKKKDWASAVDALTGYTKSTSLANDFSPEVRHLLALSFFNMRQFDKAIGVFNEMIKFYPNQPVATQNALLGLAKTYYEMGNIKEGAVRFKEIAVRFPKTNTAVEALIWLGQYNMNMKLFYGAVDNYLQALSEVLNNDKVNIIHFELARAYQSLEQYDKAFEHFRLVGKEDPVFYPKAKLAMAEIFSKEIDPEKAISTYRGIMETNPEFKRDALVKIAQIYRKQRQYKDELSTYHEALDVPKGESETTNAFIQFAIGDVYEILGEQDKALEIYFKIPYVYSKELTWVLKAYLRIGKIYENKEDWGNALSTYKKILDMNIPESKFANERIEWIKNRHAKK